MSTTEEKAIYLGVKMGEVKTHLDTHILGTAKDMNALAARLRTQELEMVTCRRAFDAAAEERATLTKRLDGLVEPGLSPVELGMRITDLEFQNAALTDRFDKLEAQEKKKGGER